MPGVRKGPPPDADPADPHHRRLIKGLRFGAAILLVFGVVEYVALDVRSLTSVFVRLIWAAVALSVAWALTHTTARWRSPLLSLLAAASAVLYALLVNDQGGAVGVQFAFFTAVPLVFSVLMPGEVKAVLVGSTFSACSALVLLALAETPTPQLRMWTVALIAAALIAVYAAAQHRRMTAAVKAATDARLASQKELAVSEARRTHAERVALLSQLAGGLAHEVNNPLSVVSANLSHLKVLSNEGPLVADLDLKELLQESTEGVQRIARVIGNLKALAPQIEVGGACSLHAVVQSSLAAIGAVPGGVAIHHEVSPSVPAVNAAPEQLTRIVTQLVLSSIDASDATSPGRGNVWLRAEEVRGTVHLLVEDDGLQLWDMSSIDDVSTAHRGKSAGVSFGLARESLRAWGGDLSVGPRPGGGVRVDLRFAPGGVAPTAGHG